VQQHWKGLGTYGTVGLELALSVFVGLFGGQWLDRRFGTEPWLTLLGLAFGAAAGFRSLWRALDKMNREAEKEEARARELRRKYHDQVHPEDSDERAAPED
jgi:F0F1-type ATP synthase assembly protein I